MQTSHQLQALLEQKLLHKDDISSRLDEWRKEKKKIVFTNGCFDLLHLGHLCYLMEAAKLGDRLLIGINSDKGVKRLKGPMRPCNDERTRAGILSCLFFVDAVTIFHEDTPFSLISLIKPDVLVKGGDYDVKDIIGADYVLAYGGKVKSLCFIDGLSTSDLIENIRQNGS